MGKKFQEAVIGHQIGGLPKFDFFLGELALKQGIADFVGGINSNRILSSQPKGINHLESSSHILSRLTYKSGRTLKYLNSNMDYNLFTIHRGLDELEKNGYIVQKQDLYYLNDYPDISKVRLWTFELKLSDWKRALFQALQYCSFTDYAIVVFPPDKKKILLKNISIFLMFKIGVLLFDPIQMESEWLVRPKFLHYQSKFSRVYALNQIINRKRG